MKKYILFVLLVSTPIFAQDVNKSKNLSDTKARTTQGDVFINGFKVKAISGADSTKLKIKTKKFN